MKTEFRSNQENRQGRREMVKKIAWVAPAAMTAVLLSQRPAYAQSIPDNQQVQ